MEIKMSGKWNQVSVKIKTENLETVTAVMSMLDNGLMIEDYSDFTLNGMYGDLVDDSILNSDKAHAVVSIFVPEEKNTLEYISFLKDRFSSLEIEADISVVGLSEDDWAEAWKKYYTPIPLGKVTIVPAWEKYEAKGTEVIVKMDPGMAFGTGTHETTRLVIKLMQDEIQGGELFLDLGTGSGILSICASKLGASHCNAYDIDPVAVKVARENAAADGCQNITVGISDLLSGVDTSRGKYDFCVANIVADILIRMLPDIGAYLKDGAPLILSGIIAPRADEVRAAAKAAGFTVIREESENDWLAILVKKL